MKDSFENTAWHHRCKVFPTQGTPYTTEVGNIFVPENYTFWFKHGLPVDHDPSNPMGWAQPEGHHTSGFPERIHEGNTAYMFFGFYKIVDAGLYRQFSDHGLCTASIFAHAWSSTEDNPSCSTGVGCEGFSMPEGSVEDDAARNFTFYIGIDPTGGEDPYSENVVWSEGRHIYNVYDRISVTAEVSGTYTVFIRALSLWPFKHNDAYFDSLDVQVDTHEPRSYERIYVLLPQNAQKSTLDSLITEFYDERYTIGFSADDAGIGDLPRKEAIVVWENSSSWESEEAVNQFFATYYPNTIVSHLYLDAPLVLSYPTTHLPPYITSRFNEWRGTYYHKGLDLRSSYRVWDDRLIACCNAEVYSAGPDPFHPSYGESVILKPKENTLIRYAHLIKDSSPLKAGDRVSVGDFIGLPGNTGNSTADHLHIDVKVDGEYIDPEPLINFPATPPNPPPTPPSGPLVTIHSVYRVPGTLEYLNRVKPKIFKSLDIDEIVLVKQNFPEIKTVYRHHVEDNHYYVNNMAVDEFIERMRPMLSQHGWAIDYVESVNETVDWTEASVRKTAAFDRLFADRISSEGFKPVCLNIAVGNPLPEFYHLLIPAVNKIVQHDGLFGYHAYWGQSHLESHFSEHAGRFMEMDKVFPNKKPKYFLGEAGMCGFNGAWLPRSGWRNHISWEEYKQQIRNFNAKLKTWNQTHQNRCVGAAIFTVSGHGWESFFYNSVDLANDYDNI